VTLDRARLRAMAEILASATALMPIAEQIESAPDVGLLALLCQRLSLVRSLDEHAIGDLTELDRRVRTLAGDVHDCSAMTRSTRFRGLRVEIAAFDTLLTDLADVLATTSGNGVSRSGLVDEARSDMISRALHDLLTWRAVQTAKKSEETLTAERLLVDRTSVVKALSADERPVEPAEPPEPAGESATSPPGPSERTQAIDTFARLLETAECQQKRSAVRWLLGEIGSIAGVVLASLIIEPGLSHDSAETLVFVHGPIWLGLVSVAALCHRLSAQHRQKENEYRTDRLSSVANPNMSHHLEQVSPAKREEIIIMAYHDWFEERRSFRKILRKDRSAAEKIFTELRSTMRDLAPGKGGDGGQ
jgi:hypothetical protein